MRMLIGGDVRPGGSNLPAFESGDVNAIWNDLWPELVASDLTILNFEAPLTDRARPIAKTGRCFMVPTAALNGLKAIPNLALVLANNHISDQGEDGVLSTLDACVHAGIATIGAGRNLRDAARIQVFDKDGVRIAVSAMAEHEFSIAGENRAGAAPIDAFAFLREVRDFAGHYDFLVVILHAGKEYYPYPTPNLARLCRQLVDHGADLVVVQHSHCSGCVETYCGKRIVYGQGNLVFEPALEKPASWYEGVLVKATFACDGSIETTLIPYVQSRGCVGARLMTGAERSTAERDIGLRSDQILQPGFLSDNWERQCTEHESTYLDFLTGWRRTVLRLNRHGLLFRLLTSRQSLLSTLNAIRCETHSEAIRTILERKTR